MPSFITFYPEEKCFNGRRSDHPEQRNGKEEPAKAGRLPRIAIPDVVSQNALSLDEKVMEIQTLFHVFISSGIRLHYLNPRGVLRPDES